MDPAKRDSLVTTVKLFAFGTIREYQALKEKDGDSVWTLTDAQLDKLRMLSVVSVARRGQNKSCEKADVEMILSDHAAVQNDSSLSIPYAHLATELQITPAGTPFNDKDHMRQLEDVLIQCVYSNIIVGKLDQASKAFMVESHVALQEQQQQPSSSSLGMKKKADGANKSAATTSNTVHGSLLSRDIDTTTAASTNTEVKRMIFTLEQFLTSSNKLLSSLEDISNLSASVRKEDEKRWRNVEKKLSEEASGASRFRAPGGDSDIIFEGGGSDPMEVVDMSGRRKVKRSRGGHVGGRF
jgi:hypothetical protein